MHNDTALKEKLRKFIAQHQADGICVSAISCWEVAMLASRGRTKIPLPISDWLDAALNIEGVRLVGLTPAIAVESQPHDVDPAQARARLEGAPLRQIADRGVARAGSLAQDPHAAPVQRERAYPHSRLKGQANVLIFPNLDAANIAYEAIKVLADALPVGPILIGAACPAHVLTPSVTARGIVNMTAVAVVEAQACRAAAQ